MQILRQSTASQAVLIGPFVDSTDGNTAETGLTIANTDIRLSKNGANIAAKNSGGGTHDELGYYTITLDATDTDTVGRLQLMVHMSGALPVYHEFQVVEESVYDNLYASSAVGPLTAAQVNAQVDTALSDYDGPTNAELEARTLTAASYATASALATVDSNVDAILVDTGTTLPGTLSTIDGKIDTVDANVDAVLEDTGTTIPARLTGIEGSTFDTSTDSLEAIRNRGDAAWTTGAGGSAPTASEIADAVWDEDLTGHTTEDSAGATLGNVATGTPPTAEAIRQEIDANSTQLAAILTDTGTTLPATLATIEGYIDTEVAAILEDTGTTIPALIAALNNLSQADIRTAIGMASANLDTQLAALPTAAENRAEMDSNSTQLAAIVADTNELQGDDVPGLIGALNDFDPSSDTVSLAPGGITASTIADGAIDAAALATDAVQEIRDAILAGTVTELTGVPAASPTLIQALAFLYMAVRNRRDTTASSDEIHNNAGTAIAEATLSDDGTVLTRGEYS